MKEIEKYVRVKFVKPTIYSPWISNAVLGARLSNEI